MSNNTDTKETFSADGAPDYVDEFYPESSPVRFQATIAQMRELLGEPNSTDDPYKTNFAYNVTDGGGSVHCYDWKNPSSNGVLNWSVRGGTPGIAERFAAWVEQG